MLLTLKPSLPTLKQEEKNLARIMILASLLFHIIAATFSIGFHHYDEHFQILEFAALKLGLTTEEFLAWEYAKQIRPALQPAIAYFFIKYLGFNDVFAAATFLRFLSGILGWFALWYFVLYAIKWIQQPHLRRLMLLAAGLLWFFPYIHVRYSSESWSMAFFFIGLTLFLQILDRKPLKLSNKQVIALVGAGLLFGLSYVCRFQSAVLIPGLFIWALFINKNKLLPLFYVAGGVLVGIAIGVLADYWFYGEWVNSAYNYFHENIVNDVASKFGTEPWWWYFPAVGKSGQLLIGWLIVISGLICFVRFPKNPVTWAAIPFLLLHCIIAHKELRFLFPLANFIPLWIALWLDGNLLQNVFTHRKRFKVLKIAVVILLAYNICVMLAVSTRAAHTHIAPIEFIYKNYRQTGATVAYFNENIYHSMAALEVNYYHPPAIDTFRLKNTVALINLVDTSSQPVLYWAHGHQPPTEIEVAGVKAVEVYSTLPHWLTRFDFNNWVKRTRVQKVYRLEKN